PMRPRRFRAPHLFALLLTTSQFVSAQATHVWLNPGGGSWKDSINWSSGSVPNEVDATVEFAHASPGSFQIDLDGGLFSLGSLLVSNSSSPSNLIIGSPNAPSEALHLVSSEEIPILQVDSNL